MSEAERRALERQFESIWELIGELDDVSARLRARAEEAGAALGLPLTDERTTDDHHP